MAKREQNTAENTEDMNFNNLIGHYFKAQEVAKKTLTEAINMKSRIYVLIEKERVSKRFKKMADKRLNGIIKALEKFTKAKV
ncbi:MAG: hypothetical protein CMH63_01505 [Nanoarchaeota archaeon]|jgi:hypothetical protein|nr:hypothetical protein [Nanoarchaeota archaeon]|tara:strand:+ start:80684 stop:80929 length:246 start_codon:yes stop_codon:yes gene_type:complete